MLERGKVSGTSDDAFCEQLYQEYKAAADKGEFISLDEAARELGVPANRET